MKVDLRDAVATLFEQAIRLQQQLDQSASIEVALIATLKELVPGFGPRFEELHSASHKMFAKPTEEMLQRIRKAAQGDGD
jgi:hypothetical protein